LGYLEVKKPMDGVSCEVWAEVRLEVGDWKTGGPEDGKTGGLEDRKTGRLEDGKTGGPVKGGGFLGRCLRLQAKSLTHEPKGRPTLPLSMAVFTLKLPHGKISNCCGY